MHSLLKPKSRKGKGRNPLGSPEAGTSLVTVEREDEKYSLSERRNPLGSPEAGTSLATAEREDEKYSLSEERDPLGSPEAGTSLATAEREDEKYSLSEGRRPLGSPEAGTSLVTAEREDEKYSLSEGRHPLGSLGTSTSLWTVERKDEKHSLHLIFPEHKQLEVYFDNRASDDLPTDIKETGAVWHKEESAPEGTYKIKVNDLWYNVEYINDEWYYTYWSMRRGQYAVIGSDLIKQPHYYGLGTKSLPYTTREDKPQESPKEESPQTT